MHQCQVFESMSTFPATTTSTDTVPPSTWKCLKCNMEFGNNMDEDFHNNTVHANWNDPMVVSWHRRGRPGMSPYD